MTKEQVRLKAEEIQASVFYRKWSDYAELEQVYEKGDIIKAMLEFGLYIEELTKQRCLELPKIKGLIEYQYGCGHLGELILGSPNLCSNET